MKGSTSWVEGGPPPELVEMIEQEEMSVDNADIFGEQRQEGPFWELSPSGENLFAKYLHSLDGQAVDDNQADWSRMEIDYVICTEELSAIINRSWRALMCLQAGHARISEIPEELMAEDAGEERAKWLEDRIPADFDESGYFFSSLRPMEEKGADR